MNYKKYVKKAFYVFIFGFSLLNILLLKNLMQNSTISNENFSFNITFSPKNSLIILENQSKKETSNCQMAFDDSNHNSVLNISTQDFLVKYSRLENKCVNYLSANGVKQEEWVTIEHDYENGFSYFNFNKKYLLENKIRIKICKYATISWHKNDFEYKIGDEFSISNGSRITNENEEFFYIKCKSTLNLKYETVYARILVKNIPKQAEPKQPINVLMLGLDSVSRNLWLESLPMTSNYLLNSGLKAKVLSQYNIAGDGTPANLIPMLTGSHEHKLPNTIKFTPGSSFVDEVYPFIWKDFKSKLNYATMFGEDWPGYGAFNYRMNGMSKPPVTHYMR